MPNIATIAPKLTTLILKYNKLNSVENIKAVSPNLTYFEIDQNPLTCGPAAIWIMQLQLENIEKGTVEHNIPDLTCSADGPNPSAKWEDLMLCDLQGICTTQIQQSSARTTGKNKSTPLSCCPKSHQEYCTGYKFDFIIIGNFK